MDGQKSAEGIVASVQGSEGPNMEERKGTDTLMDEADADRKAEIPEDSRKARGGTSRGMGRERQAPAAVEGDTPTGDDDAFRGGAAPREPGKGIP